MASLGTEGTGDLLFGGFLRLETRCFGALIGEEDGLLFSHVLVSLISLHTV